jgi:O-antigen ligase
LGAIGIALLIGLVFYYAPPQYFERMDTLKLAGEDRDGSAQGRMLTWEAGMSMAADHPFLGVGAGHFPVKYGVEYRPKGIPPTAIPWQTAHSIYFLVLGELGVPGILFLLAMLLVNFFSAERLLGAIKRNSTPESSTYLHLITSLNASLIAFAVGGAFLSALYYPHIYILAALWEGGRELYKGQVAAGLDDHSTDARFAYRVVPT